MSTLTDKERLLIVANNVEGFWAAILKENPEEPETLQRILKEDVACLREIAGRLP